MDLDKKSSFEKIIRYPFTHMRVLGPPGSGKTRLVLERFFYVESRGQGEDPGALIVTFSRESQEYLLHDIIPPHSCRMGPSPVHTYSSLASQVISSCGVAPPRIVSGVEELAILERVVGDRARSLGSSYKAVRETDGFKRALLEVIHFLLQNGYDRKMAREVSRRGRVGERLRDIFLIYDGFLEALEAKGLATFYDLAWRAVRTFREGPQENPFPETRVLIVEDFQDIDPGQFHLLETVFPPGGKIAVNVFGDPTGSRFGFRGTQHRFLMEEFPTLYRCDTIYLRAVSFLLPALGPPLRALLGETVGEDAGRYLPVGSAPGERESDGAQGEADGSRRSCRVSVFVAEDEFVESQVVARYVKHILEDLHYRPDEIAVAARDKSRYEPLLSAAFYQHGIPLETGRTVHGVFRGFLLSFLKLIKDPNDEVALEGLLTSPFYPSLEGRVFPLFSIKEKAPPGDESRGGIKELLRAMASRMSGVEAAGRMRFFVETLVKPVLSEFDPSGDDLALYTLSSRLLEEWDRYSSMVSALGGEPGLSGFVETGSFFRDEILETQILPGSVGLYSCHQLKGRYFKAVCLVGCSEMIFPGAQVKGGVIPYEVLKGRLEDIHPGKRLEVFQARTADEHLRDEYSLLYLAITRATSDLFITAPKSFGGEEFPAPAGVLSDTLAPFALDHPPFDPTPPAVRFAEKISRAKSSVHSGELLNINPIASLWGRERCRERTFAVSKFPLSESSLRTFVACERRFFYQKVLRLPEEEKPSLKLGILFHQVLEKLCKRYPSREALQAGVPKDFVGTLIEEALAGGGILRQGSFFGNLFEKLLEGMVTDFLSIEAARQEDYAIAELERPFTFSYRGWEFRGRIDRMDASSDGRALLVDYKTVGSPPKKGKTLRERVLKYEGELEKQNWQVPVYCYSVFASTGRFPLCFTYYFFSPGERAFMVKLWIHLDRESLESSLEAMGGEVPAGISYLLADEVKGCMDKACSVAERIFAKRVSFPKTGKDSNCFRCRFREFCRGGLSGA